jgi:methionyl-tRNA formyltransferase
MAPEIDAGDIIAQERVAVDPWDTAESLHARLTDAALELLWQTWARIVDGTAPRIPQTGPGTEHRKRDLEAVTLRLGTTMPVGRVLAILRARTFAGYPGVRFTEDGQTWDVTVDCRKVEP